MDVIGDEADVEIELLEQGADEFAFIEVGLIFPEELAPVDNAAVAEVEQIDGDQRRFGVQSEDVGIVAFGGGHLLTFFDLFDSGEQIAERASFLEAQGFGGKCDAGSKLTGKFAILSLEEEPGVAYRLGVLVIGGESGSAGSLAAMDVILQARLGVGSS